ncbi:MAG: DUF3857 domain-containing protein [Polyangia bacterium]
MFRLAIATLLALAIVARSFPALAEDRALAAVEEHLVDLRRASSAAEAELLLLEIFALWDAAGAQPVRRALKEATDNKRLPAAAKHRAATLLARADLRLGRRNAARRAWRELGYLDRWLVSGPYDNEAGLGLATSFAPEDGENAEWRPLPEEACAFGSVRIDALFEPFEHRCAYLSTDLISESEGRAVLRIGTGGAVRAFWNGVEALSDERYRGLDPDRLAAAVHVRKGANRLLVKVCSDERGRASLLARVTDRRGRPWPAEIDPETDRISEPPGPPPRRLKTSFDDLLSRAEQPRSGPRDWWRAAEFALLSNALDPASHKARDLARRACRRSNRTSYCLTWADLAANRNERRVAIQKALDADPGSAPALLARTELLIEGTEPGRAATVLEQVSELAPYDLEAAVLEARLLARRGLNLTAAAEATRIAERFPDRPLALRAAYDLSRRAEAVSFALRFAARYGQLRADDVDLHGMLARSALAAGDGESLALHCEAMLDLAGAELGVLETVSALREGAGDEKTAVDLLRRAARVAPESPPAHEALGRLLLRIGRRDEGIEHLERSLALAPQDSWLAGYLEHLAPRKRFEQPWVVPAESFLAERGQPSSAAARYLVDNTVVRVHFSGLSSRFTQIAVELLSREATREWRRYSVQYEPGDQRVEILSARVHRPDGSVRHGTPLGSVSVSEPWYRLFYDMRAEVIELPPLEPGDVLDLRFRVDDMARRNAYADYFGDLVRLQDELPRELWRYVLISPAARRLLFRPPELDGRIEHYRESSGDEVTNVFSAESVPRVHEEHDMPGGTSTSAYLHVSTYESWTELGRWYRGLIRDQIVADERLSSTARKLVKGLENDCERVRAIHRWVVTSTRYVGLEFGIHGYRPYRAPLVAARGFGDCKDKAALLVAMLGVVGVEAELALVRTRSLGEMDPRPASLSAFNHAIVYVPSLEIWLDATAEHHGPAELPFQDQDVMALRISDDGVLLDRTDLLPAEASSSTARVEVLLEPDGDARLETSAEVTGQRAARLRTELEAESTRRERFEHSLTREIPGVRLGELEISPLDDPALPVRYSYDALAPSWARFEDDRLRVPIDEGLALAERYLRLPERRYPLSLGPRRTDERNLSVELPSGFEVESLPSSTAIATRFGELSLEIEISAGRLEVRREFALRTHLVEPSDYAEFAQFCRDVDEALGRVLRLRRRKR